MLIRCQGKKRLINFDLAKETYVKAYYEDKDHRLYDSEEKEPNVFMIMFTGLPAIGGTYSTEEKAIKVLDMIETRYHDIEMSKIPDYDTGWAPFTFQMPSDEEVEG